MISTDSDGTFKVGLATKYMETFRRFYPGFKLERREVDVKPAKTE